MEDKNILDVFIEGEHFKTKDIHLKFIKDSKIQFFEDENYFAKYTLLRNDFENLGYFVLFYSAEEYLKNLKDYNIFLKYIFLIYIFYFSKVNFASTYKIIINFKKYRF